MGSGESTNWHQAKAHLLIPALFIVVGLPVCVAGLYWGDGWTWASVTYDMGVGVLIAGGVSLAASVYLQGVEDRDRQRREELARHEDELRQAAASERAAFEKRMTHFNEQIDDIGSGMTAAVNSMRDVLLQEKLATIMMNVEALHDEVRFVRKKVDPEYRLPHEDELNEIVETALRAMRNPGEQGAPSVPPSDSPHGD